MLCPTIDPVRWLQAPELVDNGFPLSVIEPTGEIQAKARKATYKGLTFTIIPSTVSGERLTMAGSLHRYYANGLANNDRFPLSAIQTAIGDLVARFGLESERTELENVEIGVNLSLPYSPARVLRSVVAYRGQPYQALDPRKPTIGKLCNLSDYEIKLYDKGKQSGNHRANLLRVEVRVKRMRFLKRYGIVALSDLGNPAKVRPLVEVLLSAIDGTVFIDSLANTDLLTSLERETYLRLQVPCAWDSNGLSRRMRVYYRQQLSKILDKCNAYDYQTALRDWVVQEWETLIGSAENDTQFMPVLQPSEAVENVTFVPLECVGENVTLDPHQLIKKTSICFSLETSLVRVCESCQKPLIGQKPNSRFCSEKYNGSQAAHRCRNQDSNKRRTKRNQIMKAKERNQFLRITYTHDGQTYTDTLHSSEVAVSREYLDSVVSVEVLPACRDAETSGSTCYGHCPCQPQVLSGSRAKDRLEQLTADNKPDAPSHTECIICPACQAQEVATVTHSVPFNEYVHTCNQCGYVITKSEWDEVKADLPGLTGV